MEQITKEYLRTHLNEIFVFGDNTQRKGKGGAATLRDEPNTYGFITKKYPGNKQEDFYTSSDYGMIYKKEIEYLSIMIKNYPEKIFLISKLGAGLANRYNIFEQIIEPNIKKDLSEFTNIRWLW